MHMQVHRPRNVACPVCHQQRFKSGANAVQHLESGYCSGCRGKDKARRQIYDFVKGQKAARHYVNGAPMLTNGDSYSSVPDYPYQCPQCSKAFRQLSQLLQHEDQKHQRNVRLIGY